MLYDENSKWNHSTASRYDRIVYIVVVNASIADKYEWPRKSINKFGFRFYSVAAEVLSFDNTWRQKDYNIVDT